MPVEECHLPFVAIPIIIIEPLHDRTVPFSPVTENPGSSTHCHVPINALLVQ